MLRGWKLCLSLKHQTNSVMTKSQNQTYTAARIAAVQYVNLTYKAKCCEGYTEPAFLKIADQSRAEAKRWLFRFNQKYGQLYADHGLPERWGPQEFLEYDNKQPIK